MKLLLKTPQKALNKAFLKQRPLRADMDLFKTNLITLLNKIDEIEREENQKNHVRDFLLNTYYKNTNEVNTKGTQDLVIHNGKDNKSSVGVIIEAKRPTNKNEWISVDKPNGKAFQELVLYYLRERIEENNIDIKYLIATNINEWYIFEASYFEKTFFQNKKFVKEYEEWRDGKKVTKDTKLFYNEIAKPYIDTLQSELECTFFNIKDYEKVLKNESLEDDKSLIALLKILSPNHLLKVPFANDSNSLDKAFYGELLHLIGLTETKEGGKKLIQRQPEGNRNEGSLLENAIAQLESHDKILRLDTPSQYGNTHQERLFNVGLELVITWMNRILFLKLLEAQLLTYHKGDKKYAFLNLDKIKDYDELDKLFFSVLAKKVEERTPKINETFGLVPYLNSSLFEPTELEHQTLFINALDGNVTLPLYSSSVVNKDKKRKETLNGITYLFEFLNAYDFSSDGSGEIQEDNKKLINASVLGLIFEKINGYKDGSFFTPGFITMYMSRETIRRAVIQKFKDSNYKLTESSDIETNFNELYDQIENRKEANEIINSLKICDPAVGSGHFLVSALNEIIAIKSDLKILEDKEGKSLNRYEISVENDELVVTDEDGELYEYNPNNKESQRIQETLFHEKQTIIENCLFGVDINPNSVKICRLRLWVELLKNAYYRTDSDLTGLQNLSGLKQRQLETLPNIDINIKCGNSLISRFGLDADIKKALKKSKWNVESYQLAVQTYRHAQSKEEKWEMERLIKDIKSDFRTEINKNDPKLGKLYKLNGELTALTTQIGLFGMTPKEKKVFNKKVEVLSNDIKKLDTEIEEIKSNKIYENAFEWRFEFPEVLNNDGDFVGFDVVIGNPPYMRVQEIEKSQPNEKRYYESSYINAKASYDLANLFFELAVNIAHKKAHNSFIFPHKFFNSASAEVFREYLFNGKYIDKVAHFGANMVFDDADTYTCVAWFSNNPNEGFYFQQFPFKSDFQNLMLKNENYGLITYNMIQKATDLYGSNQWIMFNNEFGFDLFQKIYNLGSSFKDKFERIFQGIATGKDELYLFEGIEDESYVKGYFKDSKEEQIIEKGILKPFLKGKDVQRYSSLKYGLYILFPYQIDKNGKAENMTDKYILENFPNAFKWLKQTEKKHRAKDNKSTNDAFWYRYARSQGVSNIEIPKLSSMEICASKPNVIFNYQNFYHSTTVYSWVKKETTKESYEYLLAIANSSLLWWFLKTTGDTLQGDARRFKTNYLNPFPIPKEVSYESEERIKLKVKDVLTLKKENPDADTLALEKEIDKLVYELYGLTDEEIKIVEGV